MAKLLVALTFAWVCASLSAQPSSHLASVKARLAAGDLTLKPSCDALLGQADKALKISPPTVTAKTNTAASGSKHDYLSQAPYFWPDPAKPNGMPYIRRDGQVNPEARSEATDQRRLNLFSETVETLCLAYALSGDEIYAAHAALCLRTWFIEPATKMNPNFEYAQYTPGRNTGRGFGIIEAVAVIKAIGNSRHLVGSPHWPESDAKALHAWGALFLDWLLTSKNGLDEAAARNNHGTIYDVLVTRLALALGRTDIARQILAAVPEKRIGTQIASDGSQPHELIRTKSFGYCRLNLDGLTDLAEMAQPFGIDLWHYETADGRSLRKAIEYMLPYLADPSKPWPHQQISEREPAEFATILRRAAIAYNEPRYAKILGSFPIQDKSRTLLTQPSLPDTLK